MKHWILGALLGLLAPLSFAGTVNQVTVSLLGYSGGKTYTRVTPAADATECTNSNLWLPAINTDDSKAMLSLLLSAQASQNKVTIGYTVPSPGVCQISSVGVYSGS